MTKQAEICLCSVEVESWMCFSQRHCPEWLESRWPVFCEHWQVSPLHWVCLAAPTKAEHTCRQPPVAAEAKREVRRHKAHVINHQSVTFSFELDLKQPTTWNWNKFNHSSCRAPFRGRFLFFRFCFGGLGGGGGEALVLQEGCEFAEELLHKENVPHCLQGDGDCQMEQVFFTLYLVPKWQLHSGQLVFNMDWLIYLCRIIIFAAIWHQIQTALNVKCYLLMCWSALWSSVT